MNEHPFYVYIMTNKNNTVLYTGATGDISRRIEEHKGGLAKGFSKKFNVNKLVYYEVLEDAVTANLREKQIKGGSRPKKVELINSMNKEWRDLSKEVGVLI